MRKSLFWVFLFAAVPVLLWAAAPAANTSGLPAYPAPDARHDTPTGYNDGWIEVFKVPIIGTDAYELRGRQTLDAFDSTFYLDTFEGDCTAWVPEDLTLPPPNYWHLDDTLALGGTGLAWWCADTTLVLPPGYKGGYDDHRLEYLLSDTMNFSSAAAPITLAFQARWKVEAPGGEPTGYDMWDAWNVWASTDNGATWTVRTPVSPAYTGTSSYAFGYEWGMGTGIPGYAGANVNFVTCTFNLSDLAGQSSVIIRWAFCSDPGFSTQDDPTMFGLIIDSIRVTDASRSVLLSNDGEADEFAIERGDYGTAAGITWQLDGSTYHSASHCWTAAVSPNLVQILWSAPVTLPPASQFGLLRARYWVWCDMPDTDGDGDGYLDDFFDFWVNDVDSGTYRRIVYDWAKDFGNPPPDGNSALGWILRSQAAKPGTGGYTLSDISLTPWAGRTIRIAFRHITDDNDDGGTGTGLHIDDVELWGTRAFTTDLATRDFIFKFPTTVGLNQQYQYTLYNAGLGNLGNQLRHRIRFYRPNGTQWFDSLIVTSGTLYYGQDTTLFRRWTPQVTGSHRMWVYATYTGDPPEEDRSNDTTRTPINVPLNSDSNLAVTVRPAGQYELAYHTRAMSNAYLNPRYVRYTPLADGVPPDSANGFDITTVRVVWQFDPAIGSGSATSWIEFWADSLPTYPGRLLKRFEVEIDTLSTIGAQGKVHWWTLDVSNTPELTNLTGNFWVSLTPKDSIGGGPVPLPMGKSVEPVAYDGHHFVIRLDSSSAFMPSPGRYLLQTTIVPTRMPGRVGDLVIRRDGVTDNIVLNWGAAPRATGYKVYRLANPSQHYTQGTLLTPTPVTGTTYTDTGVAGSNNKYFYQVIAVN